MKQRNGKMKVQVLIITGLVLVLILGVFCVCTSILYRDNRSMVTFGLVAGIVGLIGFAALIWAEFKISANKDDHADMSVGKKEDEKPEREQQPEKTPESRKVNNGREETGNEVDRQKVVINQAAKPRFRRQFTYFDMDGNETDEDHCAYYHLEVFDENGNLREKTEVVFFGPDGLTDREHATSGRGETYDAEGNFKSTVHFVMKE